MADTETPTTMVDANIPNLDPGESGLLLDGVEYVAWSADVTRDDVHSELTCRVLVRAVTSKGLLLVDAHGAAIVTRHTWSMDAGGLDSVGGVNGFILETLKVALGDDDAHAEVNDSIRLAIKAADVMLPTRTSFKLSDIPKE